MEKGSARDGLSARNSLLPLFKIYYLLEDNCLAVLLVSAIQERASALRVHMSPPSETPSHRPIPYL